MWEDSELASLGWGWVAFPALTDCVSTGFIIQPVDTADRLSFPVASTPKNITQGQTTPVGVRLVKRDLMFALAAVTSFSFDGPTKF